MREAQIQTRRGETEEATGERLDALHQHAVRTEEMHEEDTETAVSRSDQDAKTHRSEDGSLR